MVLLLHIKYVLIFSLNSQTQRLTIYSSNNQHRFLPTIGPVMVPLAHRPHILSLHKARHRPKPLANTMRVPVPFQPLVEFQLWQHFLTISPLPQLLGL